MLFAVGIELLLILLTGCRFRSC